MKRKPVFVLLSVLLCLVLATPAFAASETKTFGDSSIGECISISNVTSSEFIDDSYEIIYKAKATAPATIKVLYNVTPSYLTDVTVVKDPDLTDPLWYVYPETYPEKVLNNWSNKKWVYWPNAVNDGGVISIIQELNEKPDVHAQAFTEAFDLFSGDLTVTEPGNYLVVLDKFGGHDEFIILEVTGSNSQETTEPTPTEPTVPEKTEPVEPQEPQEPTEPAEPTPVLEEEPTPVEITDPVEEPEPIETLEPIVTPKPVETEEPAKPVVTETKHTVVAGDTLGAIAKKYYGDVNKYTKIYESNKAVLKKGPHNLTIGMVLTLPAEGLLTTDAKDKAQDNAKVYIVKAGDTLGKIAASFYGDAKAYTKIYEANKNTIKNPNMIFVGQKIVIPE